MTGNKSIRCLAGRQCARELPDGSLPISPDAGGAAWGRDGAEGGGHTAWHSSLCPHLVTTVLAGSSAWPEAWKSLGELGAAGGAPLFPHLLRGFVPKFEPKSAPPEEDLGLELLLAAGIWAPQGGHGAAPGPGCPLGLFTNRRELAQGSRAPPGPGGL